MQQIKSIPKNSLKLLKTYELYEFDKIREKDLKRVKKGTSKAQRQAKTLLNQKKVPTTKLLPSKKRETHYIQ